MQRRRSAQLEVLLSRGGPGPAACWEWCRLATASGVRAPPGLVGALFDFVRDKDWAGTAEAVFGARLAWLRGLDGTAPWQPDAADWTSPDLLRRVAALGVIRADPAAGREALASVWKGEPADARARLLAALRTGLGGDDEPFLEERLDDRSVQVRAEAVRLLTDLPGSRWAGRMQARAAAAVQLKRGGFFSRDAMTVTLPVQDDAARRDGLDAKGAAGPGAVLLGQLAAAAPLASWDGAAPERWIKLALAGEWAEALVPGWAAAAVRERDAAWLAALLDALPAVPNAKSWIAQTLGTLAPALPAAELERAMLSALRGGLQQPGSLMQACVHDWSPGFTRGVLDWLAAKPATGDASRDFSLHYAMKGILDLLAAHGDVNAAGRLSEMQAGLPELAVSNVRRAFDDAAATLRFRQAMHQELAR